MLSAPGQTGTDPRRVQGVSCPCGIDHHSGDYTERQRADLELVLGFNSRMADSIDACRDTRAADALLDPDPLRYMWVDEGAGRIPELLARADALLAQAAVLPGHRRVDGRAVTSSGWATRPSVATAPDGRVLHVWLEWVAGEGDRVLARLDNGADAGPVGEPVCLVPDATDCFRPTALFDAEGRAWVAYARSRGGEVAVCCRRYASGRWSPEEQVSDTAHPSFNQELVAHDDGSVEACWQARTDDRFGIWSRRWRGGWSDTRLVSEGTGPNVWDPTVVARSGGSTYAWTEYDEGAYRVVLRTGDADGTLSPTRPLTGGSDYALHPSLAVRSDGTLWCAFDLITMQGHAGSGPTRLRPAEALGADPARVAGMRAGGDFVPPELRPEVSASVRVVRVDDDGLAAVAGELAPGLDIVPGGLPRLVADATGGLTVCYRVHRRLPLMTFYWEVAAQSLGPGGWEPPVTVRGSDGTLEEAAVAPLRGGVLVSYQSDRRLERALAWTEGFGGRECPHLLEHHGSVIWHGMQRTGEVRCLTLPAPAGTGTDSPVPVGGRALVHSAERVEARRWAVPAARGAAHERYTTSVQGTELTLYWGDLHRHSLVSRCTAGDEPSLDDFYRYSWDVCDYDFWAVTDHSENSSDYQWWSIQKIADLFRVDGRFVPLYGFEWTGLTGHQNVVFGDVARGAPIFSAYAAGSDTQRGLWEGLARHPDHPAITVPHHPGAAMVPYDWDQYDPRFLRLAEVFQACRGNYEDDGCFRQYADATRPGTFVLDGLRRGHRFGLIASSDHGHGASYVGAYAERLDRASVFAALHQRRVFGATTRDLLVDVRVGDTFMGGECAPAAPREVAAYARGYGELARVDLLRDGEVVHSVLPDLGLPNGWVAVPVRVEWGMSPTPTDWSGSLTVRGGEIVRTSHWSPEVVAAERHRVAWAAHSMSFGEPYGSQRGGVEVTVVGPVDAVVDVATAQGGLAVPLGRLPGRTVTVPTTGEGRLMLQPGVGGLVGLGASEHRLSWTDERPGPAWYYVRVFQTDGEMAWSSPVWVDGP